MGLYLDTLKDCGRDWPRFLLACVLLIIPGVNLLVFGYLLEVIRRARTGDTKGLPPWKGWWSLFVKGLQLLLVSVAWIAPALLLILLGGLALPSMGLLWSVLGFILGALFLYLVPSIYVRESSTWRASFSLETVRAALKLNYLFHWLIIMVLSLFFALITKPAPVLNTFPSLYLLVVMGRVFGTLDPKK